MLRKNNLQAGVLVSLQSCRGRALFLEENQGLSLFQSDMCSAFYLFRLPGMWKTTSLLQPFGLRFGLGFFRFTAVCFMLQRYSDGLVEQRRNNAGNL